MGGSDLEGQHGVYGTLGTPDPANIPGARHNAAGWTDPAGNLWLFGGDGFGFPSNLLLNDLWKFDPSSNQWTWMNGTTGDTTMGVYGTLGTPAAGNIPPGRENAVTWTDAKGNLWLFGGQAIPSVGLFNDLWKFDLSANQWAWMGGSSALPPTSCGAGIPECGQSGIYGTLGTASASNAPGSRMNAVTWTDRDGNLWLFGGYGIDSTGTLGYLNDLWQFNPSAGQWTWIGGAKSVGLTGSRLPGVYGEWMVPSAASYPGGRSGAVSWADATGHLWLFGGYGFDTTQYAGFLNDLWEFDPDTNQWAWMGGTNSSNTTRDGVPGDGTGFYGTLGSPDFQNAPGGRDSAESWVDGNGSLWLFGGRYALTDGTHFHNDLWVYRPNPTGVSGVATPSFTPNGGTISAGQTIVVSDPTPGASIYYVVGENAPPIGYTGPLTVQNSETITAFATATGYANSTPASATFTVPLAETPILSPGSGTYANAQTVSITDSTPGAKIHYRTDWIPASITDPLYTGPFRISAGTRVTAIAVADGYAQSDVAVAMYVIWPSAATNEWTMMSGDPGSYSQGIYGTLGSPSIVNFPSSRYRAAHWTDKDGNFWVMGGAGRDANEVEGYLNDLWKFDPSTNEWAWEGGNSLTPGCNPNCGQPGVYGTVNTPTTQTIPGGRQGASTWTDSQGKLWLFGGEGYDSASVFGELNDVWRFDPVAGQWTWMAGDSSTDNCFIANLSPHCAGPAGVYGSPGIPAATNVPGAREGAVTWYDGIGELWMFGGYGIDPAMRTGFYFDDLWRFDASTGEWAWMSGDDNDLNVACQFNPDSDLVVDCGHPGVYGQFGVAAPGNNPGSRRGPSTWIDKSGNLWLFGGLGFDAEGNISELNDFWEFTPSTSQWTWRGGSAVAPFCGANWRDSCGNTPYLPGVYGTMGVPDVGNIPGLGMELPSWTDKDGNFWLQGGAYADAVWEFNPSANEWTWVHGSGASVFPQVGSSGAMGTLDPKNSPGSRFGSSSWTDKSGYLWLAAGSHSPYRLDYQFSTGATQADVWAFHPSAPAPVPAFALIDSAPSVTLPQGGKATLTMTSIVGGGFNSAITLSASGQPSGVSISFSPPSLNGASTSEVSVSVGFAVPAGTYPIVITGTSGNKTATASTSLAVVAAPAFLLAAAPSSITVNSGGQGAVALTVTPQNGFNSAVSFSCSGLPAGVTCSFNPTTITPLAAPVTTYLTFTDASSASILPAKSDPEIPALSVAFAGLLFTFGKARRFRGWSVVGLVMISLGMVIGCSGGSSSGGGGKPQPTTSNITITATSGSLQQTTTISLTLN